MKKEVKIMALLLVIAVILLSGAFFRVEYSKNITGKGILDSIFDFFQPKILAPADVANIFLEIASFEFKIEIIKPTNDTHRVSNPYNPELDLEVTSTFDGENWKYKLTRLCDNTFTEEYFEPNITLSVYHKGNFLEVDANRLGDLGDTDYDSVVFGVYSENKAPVIEEIKILYVCENEQLSYFFEIMNINENKVFLELTQDHGNQIFDVVENWAQCEITNAELFSSSITKQEALQGPYIAIISAIDSEPRYPLDTELVDIVTIDVNNYPEINNNVPIEVDTVWVNESFYYQVPVYDVEDGISEDGNLYFNLTTYNFTGLVKEEIVNFFDIDNYGVINFTTEDWQVGNYFLYVCVEDLGLATLHENASLCGETGVLKASCTEFQLTITNENRAPNITDWNNDKTGKELKLTIEELERVKFNVTATDPDKTVPDIYWYVDDVEKAYTQGNSSFNYSFSEFVYIPQVGEYGFHNITARATDSMLNNSITWNITVTRLPVVPPSGGGGAGGACKEKWLCRDWGQCQEIESSRKLIDAETYKYVKERCELFLWDDCGFQVRECEEVNRCNRNKPREVQECFYTEYPDCYDKIKNCHHGKCEILIDCGGPCKSCPTCDDKKRNQGEEGVDCGGPCEPCPEKPEIIRSWYIYLLAFIALLIAIFTIMRLIKMLEVRYRYKKIKETQENV